MKMFPVHAWLLQPEALTQVNKLPQKACFGLHCLSLPLSLQNRDRVSHLLVFGFNTSEGWGAKAWVNFS